MIEPCDQNFWMKAQGWKDKGWEIALHGYNHVCTSNDGLKGMNPVWKRSEFAGVPQEEQRKKIQEGMKILRSHDFEPKYFFAPSHTFDTNTLEILRKETDIRIISDTYTLRPYKKYGFTFIPCQLGRPQKMKLPGLYTICLHPNNMSDEQMDNLEQFLNVNQKNVLVFSDIDKEQLGGMRWIDKVVQWAYFKMRNMRNAK